MARIETGDKEFTETVVKLNRVAKVVKGGKRFSFSALVVVGNGAGLVGAGLGKASEVPEAIRKGAEEAKKNVVSIPIIGTTIPHETTVKFGSAMVMLRPAALGTGVIAGGAVRAVVTQAGIKDILTKSLGSDNAVNIVYCTIKALKELKKIDEVSALRGKSPNEILQ